MSLLKVLIGKLLTVDGFATGTLFMYQFGMFLGAKALTRVFVVTYIATSEITTLQHELWNDSVEGGIGITETLLTSAKSSEVLGGLWADVVIEVEGNTTLVGLGCWLFISTVVL